MAYIHSLKSRIRSIGNPTPKEEEEEEEEEAGDTASSKPQACNKASFAECSKFHEVYHPTLSIVKYPHSYTSYT